MQIVDYKYSSVAIRADRRSNSNEIAKRAGESFTEESNLGPKDEKVESGKRGASTHEAEADTQN